MTTEIEATTCLCKQRDGLLYVTDTLSMVFWFFLASFALDPSRENIVLNLSILLAE